MLLHTRSMLYGDDVAGRHRMWRHYRTFWRWNNVVGHKLVAYMFLSKPRWNSCVPGKKKVKSIFQNICQRQNANIKNSSSCAELHTLPAICIETSDTCLFDNILPVGVRGVEKKDVGDEVVMRSIHWLVVASCRMISCSKFHLNVWGSTPCFHSPLVVGWEVSPQMIFDNQKIFLQLQATGSKSFIN